MFGQANRPRDLLILLVLLAAIIVPVVVSGYADLRRAEELTSAAGEPWVAQYYVYAATKLPWMPQLWDRAASAYALRGDCRDAIPLFEVAKARGVISAKSWVLYGVCYVVDHRDQEALATWSEGLKRYPGEPAFYFYIAQEDERQGDFAAEVRDLSIWTASSQAQAFSHYRLGKLLMASNPDRARTEFRQATSMEADFSDAVQTLDASLTLGGLETSASRRLVIIGRGLSLVGDWPLAHYDFQQAVDADPQNAEAWAWLGEAQQQNKQDGKASLDKALELDRKSSLVHGLRGLYWKRQGKYKAALAEYQAAAELEPKNPEWQAALGDAYASIGDLVQALAAYVTATTLAPAKATYWRLLALFSADNGIQVLTIGLPAARKAAEIAPKDAQVLDTLGWTYSQAGLLNTAEQTLDQAIKLAPALASAHLHLAETYLRQGNPGSAQSELNRVRELDPDGPSGAYATQLLRQYFP